MGQGGGSGASFVSCATVGEQSQRGGGGRAASRGGTCTACVCAQRTQLYAAVLLVAFLRTICGRGGGLQTELASVVNNSDAASR